jgi:subtilase family serine protease
LDLIHRPTRACAIVVAGLAIVGMTGAFSAPAEGAVSPKSPQLATLGGAPPAPATARTGPYSTSRMSVEVVLAPRNQAGLQAGLAAVYNPTAKSYQQWLAKGQFDARYAPSAATRSSVSGYLRAGGLTVVSSSSPFLIRAAGPSAKVAAVFHTTLSSYRSSSGVGFFANSESVRVPQTMAGSVLGVIGLTNTVRLHTAVLHPHASSGSSGAQAPRTTPSCETAYPTRSTLFAVNGLYRGGYAGGPGCSGLTPSQVNSIYGAPHAGASAKGAGVTLGLFEESGYQRSDIATWTRQYYGPNYQAPVTDINVDGGPLGGTCPTGDTCPAEYQGYAGDVEVDADVEEQVTIAPDAHRILVYNAPFDLTGQTALDEYQKMAADDSAAVVSESYGSCEPDTPVGYVQAENVVFEQMALQGQSVFGASGDSGAFDCLDEDGGTEVSTDDPPSQPWVTSVGGTSLESDNPGTAAHPPYPNGVETVLNTDNLCNTSADEGGHPGYYWCQVSGGGGGASSMFWGRPFYQRGPGVTSSFTTYGNGTTQCSLAATGAPCRETPDVSAVADQFTGYSEFCTGNATLPNSVCANIPADLHGWFQVGGTSLSSPLWSAIIADRDGRQGHRTGSLNPLAYLLFNVNPRLYFHDITGVGPLQAVANTNGLFPTTPGYDIATGIGTPRMSALITGGRLRP